MQKIYLYDSLTRKKLEFIPMQAGKVSMYVCGVTVYDYCHIGHARVMVVFDIISRFLRRLGYTVTYVRNITDIDDKIINRANENQEDYHALTERFIQAMNEDSQALNVLAPDKEPRATQTMSAIIDMIDALVKKNYAYRADNGDVFFEVKKYTDYGRLSGREALDQQRQGDRVDSEYKRDTLDFVLWKAAKPGEPAWDSPWGKGRPGWHIECSAMSTHFLGDEFDIHGGGMDLQFPHHENEIAQSCCASGKNFAKYWLHNGFVCLDEEKMSKSLGNFFTIREILKNFPGEVLRYFLLTSHYRSPLNYSDQNIAEAKNALDRLYTSIRGLTIASEQDTGHEQFEERFEKAMADDFATPEALAILFEMSKEINRLRDGQEKAAAQLAGRMVKLAEIFGILQQDPEQYFRQTVTESDLSDAQIEDLIAARNQARQDKDFTKSDQIRDQLADSGVILEDGAKGTTWRRK